MTRLLTKYTRFITIMARNPTSVAVPTLDVDLAWHTAQLTPSAYLAYTLEHCDKFVNHDDKVADGVLRDGFEDTSKRYQKMFGEVYSECTCWYCETVRVSHSSSAGIFGRSGQDKGEPTTLFAIFPISYFQFQFQTPKTEGGGEESS